MDSISSADRLVAILRQRLNDATARRSGRLRGTHGGESAVSPLRALVASGEAGERHVYRALIEELLKDQLGDNLSSDANFQSVVDRVLDALITDPTGAALLKGGVRTLSPGS